MFGFKASDFEAVPYLAVYGAGAATDLIAPLCILTAVRSH